MRAVGKQTFTYLQYVGRAPTVIGTDVSVYAIPVQLQGQVQAVPRTLFERYGLDLQKNYLTFFVSSDILDVERDVSGDQMQYAGKRYQVLSNTDWYAQNGWNQVLTVEVPNAG